jgi:hypothetical protein
MNRPEHTDVGTALRATALEVRDAVAAAPLAPPRPARRPRPLLAAVTVAAAVTAVVLGLTTYLGSNVRTAPPAPPAASTAPVPSPVVTTAVAPSPKPAQASMCGDALPVGVYPPKGWKGPQPGPAPDSTTEPEPGQLVVHWTGPGGSFEVRWPASTSDTTPYDPMESMSTQGDGVRSTLSMPVAGSEPPCTHLAADWLGDVPAGFGARVDGYGGPRDRAIVAAFTAEKDLKLVDRTQQVSAAPTQALPCDGADTPTRGGTASTAPQPSAEQALQAFLDGPGETAGGFNRSGWTKFVLPGGGAAFGVPFDGGTGWVQLVYATDTGDGWVVTRWTTSGC